MKYFVYTSLALIAIALFVPKTGTTQIRNLPLLLALLSLIAIFLLIRSVQYIVLILRTKHHLQKNGYRVQKTSVLPYPINKYNLTVQNENQTLHIVCLLRKRPYWQYHFDSINRLEYYKSASTAVRSGGGYSATMYRKNIETRYMGKSKLPFQQEDAGTAVLIINRMPCYVSSNTRRNPSHSAGDLICEWIRFYDAKSFFQSLAN